MLKQYERQLEHKLKKQTRPNLFLVGAMKSGSSSLTHYLHAHPQIFMTMRPKEPSYFVEHGQLKEVYPQMEKFGFWKGENNYLALFDRVVNEKIVGDASQNYARLPKVTGVAERIYSFNRNAKILYLMRDPIKRTISHYWYMVQHFGERRGMLDAIKAEPDYTATSYYAMQLKPYIELFGIDNVKAVISENMLSAPSEIMRDIYSWLEVDPTFELGDKAINSNITPPKITQARGFGLLHKLKYSKAWSAVAPRVPAPIRALGTRLSSRQVERRDVDINEVIEYLRPIQQEQTTELSKLLDMIFDEWTTLYGDG